MATDDMSGEEFRERRKRLRITQSGMATIFKCSRQYIGEIEDRLAVPPAYALAILQLEHSASHDAA